MEDDTRRFGDIQPILRGLRDSPAILAEFVREIPEDMLHRKRGEGFWSIAEHVIHLAAVQPMLAERLRRILTEDMPEFVPFIPNGRGREAKAFDAQHGRGPGGLQGRAGTHRRNPERGHAPRTGIVRPRTRSTTATACTSWPGTS
jgi:Uncharacterized protein conserved in bacteria